MHYINKTVTIRQCKFSMTSNTRLVYTTKCLDTIGTKFKGSLLDNEYGRSLLYNLMFAPNGIPCRFMLQMLRFRAVLV